MRQHSTFDTALHQLRHDHAVLALELEQIKWDYSRKFNPDQPRNPAGSSDGGQWGGGGGQATSLKPQSIATRRISAALESECWDQYQSDLSQCRSAGSPACSGQAGERYSAFLVRRAIPPFNY